jgi:hypothetical protein
LCTTTKNDCVPMLEMLLHPAGSPVSFCPQTHMRHRVTLAVPLAFLCALLLAIAPRAAHATATVANKFIQIEMDEASGQFRVWDVKASHSIIYGDGSTSFMNFRFHAGTSGRDTIFSNSLNPSFATCAGHITPDSVRQVKDSISAYFNKFGYLIRVRVYPVSSSSGNTGLAMVELSGGKTDPNTSSTLNGIQWMNDVVSDGGAGTSCNTVGDHPLILTSSHFDARPNTSSASCWIGAQNLYTQGGVPDVPDFFHVAESFPFVACANNKCALIYGKLKGPGLTPPDKFFVGAWSMNSSGLKDACWDPGIPAFAAGNDYSDAAVLYQWVVRSDPFRIATLYGLNDTVNDMHICSGPLLKEVGFQPRIERNPTTGKYNPTPDTITMYVININHGSFTASGASASIDLSRTKHLYIYGRPTNTKTATASFPSTNIGGGVGYKVQFLVAVDSTTFNQPGMIDTETVNLKVNLANAAQLGDDGSVCPIQIVVVGEGRPPADTIAPNVSSIGTSRYRADWNSADNRIYDKGVNAITFTRNDANNFALTVSAFLPCDTTQRPSFFVTVIDTNKTGCADVRVTDCAGNFSTVSFCFSPRIDSLAPVLLSTASDSTGRFPGAAACNARCVTWTASDSRSTDYGLRGIVMTNASNVGALDINNGGVITAHDKTATYRLCVVDSMRNAHADLEVTDFMGNKTTHTFDYCSVKDSAAPVIRVTRGAGKTMMVVVTDSAPWDRGLSRVYLDPTSTNVKTTPSVLTWTSKLSTFTIEPIDTLTDAAFTVCAEDSFSTATPSDQAAYFAGNAALHKTCQSGSFSGEDTIAPNIIITPLSSTSARVEINDIHIVGGVPYLLDMGIQTVVLDTHNVVIDSNYTALGCDKMIRFRIKVRDTLAFCDTAAYARISATDCRFNASTIVSWRSPITPDTRAPIVSSALDGQGRVTVTVTDARSYDRGLGTVVLTTPVNLQPHNSTANDGRATETFTLTVIDPTKDASATLDVSDRWGAYCAAFPGGAHTQSIPVNFSVTGIALQPNSVPTKTEDENFSMPIERSGTLTGKSITAMDFLVQFDSTALEMTGAGGGTLSTANARITSGTHRLSITKSTPFVDGDVFPSIQFRALFLKSDSQRVLVHFSSPVTNAGAMDTTRSADRSSFILHPPAFVVATDGQVEVTKRCDRSSNGSSFSLAQNFPNPFWQEATVDYTLPANGKATLIVYNVFGEEVRTVFNEVQTAGSHSVRLSSDGLRAGTYFYKLRAECVDCVHEYVALQRMVIAR